MRSIISREIPPQRTARHGEALRLTRDPRGRPLLLVPRGAPSDAGARFMRGWHQAEDLPLGAEAPDGLLQKAARWAEELSPHLGVAPPALALTDSRRVWGLCSARTGLVTLHADLARMPDGVGREVLLHELCHLREADHSPVFWQLMTEIMPDWAYWEGVLRCLGARLRAGRN